MSPKRGTISITRAVYDRLQAYTTAHDVSMASLVERLIEPVIAGTEPPPPPPAPPRPVPTLYRAMLDRIAADRRNLGLGAPLPRTPTGPVVLDVPHHVAQAIADRQARARAAGQEIEPGVLFEAAIERMLDALTRGPWCRTCLESPEDCRCRARSAMGR